MNDMEYHNLKRKLEQMQQEQARTQGAIEQLRERITHEIGVEMKNVKEVLRQWKNESIALEREIDKKIREFLERWKEFLEKEK